MRSLSDRLSNRETELVDNKFCAVMRAAYFCLVFVILIGAMLGVILK